MRDTLRSEFPSVEVIETGSAEEALKEIKSHTPDLIFTNFVLPGETGIEMTKKIRTFSDVTVVTLTSHDSPEYQKAALKSGADCFISKFSLHWEEISTLVRCYQKAIDENRLKPICIRLAKEPLPMG
jgi:DNA-binding NarL/FixJ family response regulator